jgi:hypothetical protein
LILMLHRGIQTTEPESLDFCTVRLGRLRSVLYRAEIGSRWKAVIRFGIRSAPKWCSRQAEFHYIPQPQISL